MLLYDHCLTNTIFAKDLAIQMLFLTKNSVMVLLRGKLLKHMCTLYLSFSWQCLFKVPDFPTPALPMMAILIRRWREVVFVLRFANSGDIVTNTCGELISGFLLWRCFRVSMSKSILRPQPAVRKKNSSMRLEAWDQQGSSLPRSEVTRLIKIRL